jgi:RNase P/RNase MRP subunit p30
MDTSVIIKRIVKEINPLDVKTKLKLVRIIMSNIRSEKKRKKKTNNLTELKGLGAEIWRTSNVDQYILNERKWE